MNFQEYLADLPFLHFWNNQWERGGFNKEAIEALLRVAESIPYPRIIETGSGNSTLCFLFSSARRVVSICPEAPLQSRILNFAEKNDIATAPLELIMGFSEDVLPKMSSDTANKFDIGLIDGGHGWPTVFIDFFYINSMMTKGGLLLVDDINLYSVRELAKLILLQTDHFALRGVLEPRGKCLVFEKVTDRRRFPDWADLRYIRKRSEEKQEAGSDMLDEILSRLL